LVDTILKLNWCLFFAFSPKLLLVGVNKVRIKKDENQDKVRDRSKTAISYSWNECHFLPPTFSLVFDFQSEPTRMNNLKCQSFAVEWVFYNRHKSIQSNALTLSQLNINLLSTLSWHFSSFPSNSNFLHAFFFYFWPLSKLPLNIPSTSSFPATSQFQEKPFIPKTFPSPQTQQLPKVHFQSKLPQSILLSFMHFLSKHPHGHPPLRLPSKIPQQNAQTFAIFGVPLPINLLIRNHVLNLFIHLVQQIENITSNP
jgi:hypothetical protein